MLLTYTKRDKKKPLKIRGQILGINKSLIEIHGKTIMIVRTGKIAEIGRLAKAPLLI